MVGWHLKHVGKWKKLDKWVPHELMQIKIIVILKCCLLLFSTTMNHFSIGLWHVMNSGFYTTTGDDHLSGWTKKKLQSTSQSQTCTTKRSWSLFGHLLPVWSTADSETIISEKYTQQINETHQKRQCLKLVWSAEWVQFFSMTVPVCTSHNQCFNSGTTRATKILPHLPYSSDFSPTDYHFFKQLDSFLQAKYFHNQQEVEECPRVHGVLKHIFFFFFCYRNKQTYFSFAKMYWW